MLKHNRIIDYSLRISFIANRLTVIFLTACFSSVVNPELSADIIVINNRSQIPILVDQEPNDHLPAIALAPGSSKAYHTELNNVFSVSSQLGDFQQPLQTNSIYYFNETTNGLRRITLSENDDGPRNFELRKQSEKPLTIRLALYVDEEEAMTDRQWKIRLAERVKSASEVLESHIGVRLAVESFNRWQSDNQLHGLDPLLADFERKTKPPAGTIAVGFSSQLHIHPTRRRNMGGTRGPLRSHLIVKEWAPRVSEVERTEILLHELGHFLGAAHSPEQSSVMRPVLASSTTRLKSQPIQYDPLNTFAMAIVSQELSARSINRLEQISPKNRQFLAGVYRTISELMPQDPTSPRMLQRVQLEPVALKNQPLIGEGIHELVQSTLSEINRVAIQNRKLPLRGGSENRRLGDDLTNLYVRTAASHVEKSISSQDIKSEAFVYALALAFDRSDRLKKFEFFKELAEIADPQKKRQLRMNVIGQPTARERDDTLLHFIISAALTLQSNSEKARFLGFTKEAFDSQPGGSGFSFADIAANESGIRFAERLKSSELPLNTLTTRFKTELFIPTLEGLPEGLNETEYLEQFGVLGDDRNDAMLEEINKRLDQLPPYLQLQLKL